MGRGLGALAVYTEGVITRNAAMRSVGAEALAENRAGIVEAALIIGSLRGGAKVDYSKIENPINVGQGKDFTLRQKQQALELNREANGGAVKSDQSGTVLAPPQKSQRGVTPNANEWQVDHKTPKNCGGTNCSSNIQILSRQENRIKSDN